jgi:uncharacterized protein
VQPTVVDAGPLVAYFDRRDTHHLQARGWFETDSGRFRLLSTEAVVTECTHLLDHDIAVQTAFVEWASAKLALSAVPSTVYPELAQWMRAYANVPMDFADATVLWLYRANPGSAILTIDQRGFGVFRLPEDKRRRPRLIELPSLDQPRKPRHAR